MKMEDVEVGDQNKAMENFESLLGKLVKVPKNEIPKRKRRKIRSKHRVKPR